MRREPQNSSILVPRFQSGGGLRNHTGGELVLTVVWLIVRDFRFSELHLGKLSDSMEFQSWKVNFKNWSMFKAADPHLTMQWIKEVEMAKSIDDLMTSQSITGRRDFPDYDMLDAMIASALKRLLDKHVHFRTRVSVEEQRAQKYDRFSRGRQIAYIICEHFRATGAYEAVQGLSDLFSIRLQNDDVQDFDVRWDQALLSASEIPTDVILEGLYKSKFSQLASYDQKTVRNNGQTSYLRLKTSSKFILSRWWELESSESRTKLCKEEQSPRIKKEGKSVFSGRHMDSVQKETHVVSVMTDWYKETCTVVRDEKDDRLLPHQIRRPRLTKGEKHPQKHQTAEVKTLQTKRREIPCRY